MNKKLIATIVTVASLFLAFSFSHGASAKKSKRQYYLV